MVKLIVGNKGSGKTKTLINQVNEAAKLTKGYVVCIEKGDTLKFDLSYHIRLINIEEYRVSGVEAYYGFICGLLAGNYDITEVFCDATFKILCGKDARDIDLLTQFIDRLVALTQNTSTTITLTLSCDPSELPAHLQELKINP